MKNLLICSLFLFSFIGCGSKDEPQSKVDNNQCVFTASARLASVHTDGVLDGLPPPPSECQEFVIVTDHGYLVNNGRKQKSYDIWMPKGYTTQFEAYPDPGYVFDGWYYNGLKTESFVFTFGESDVVPIEAIMIPVSVQ